MRVKICGLKNQAEIAHSVQAGAAYIGFVFFEKSPRNVTLDIAKNLMLEVPSGVCRVALTVNPDDAFLENLLETLPVDMVQLHGKEAPDRVAEVKQMTGLPVMKAVGVGDESDLESLDEYMRVADQILLDAKPSPSETLPGGNGISFDWRLIAGRRWPVPWMLAGGLTPQNVEEAVRLTGAQQVDVSSGVEARAGVKDVNKISAFIRAAGGEN